MNATQNHAELSILGSILLSNGTALDELNFDPASYANPRFEALHQLMQGMHTAGEPIDVVTVATASAKAGNRVDPSLLHEAIAATPTASTASHYAKIVSDASAGRKIKATAAWMAQQAEAGLSLEEIIDGARAGIDGARSNIGTSKIRRMGDDAEEFINFLELEKKYFETPWPQINHLIGGLMPGSLYIVGARPSVGKSVAALQLATSLEKQGPVVVFSLEMLSVDLMVRIAANECGIPMKRLTGGAMEPQDWEKLAPWVQNIGQRDFIISDATASTIHDIKRFVQDANRTKPLAGVVIDYLQLIRQSQDRLPEQEFLSEITRQLKLMALQMNIPIVLISQLNRGSANREDKMPRSSDLRGSGAIEQDADVVILLHRELKGEESYKIHLNVEKNRRGPAGNTEMIFQGHYSRIADDR